MQPIWTVQATVNGRQRPTFGLPADTLGIIGAATATAVAMDVLNIAAGDVVSLTLMDPKCAVWLLDGTAEVSPTRGLALPLARQFGADRG